MSSAPTRRSRRRVGFGVHQLIEYALAARLLATGARVGGGARLLALSLGGGIGTLNLLSDAPFGIYALCSRRLHHLLDVLISLGAILSPILCFHALGVGGLGVGLLAAASLAFLQYSTSYALRPPRLAQPPGVARSTNLSALAPVAGALTRRSARGLGRLTGQATRISRELAARRAEGQNRPS